MARHWYDLAFFISLTLLCSIAVFIGVAPIRLFAHDTFFFLENGYRVLQGQVPHRDFQSAWGPTIYLVEAFGLILARMQADGVGYANAFFGALIATWAYAIARSRLAPSVALGLAYQAY